MTRQDRGLTGLDLGAISSTLAQDGAGIWTAPKGATPEVFPDGAHNDCFALEDGSFWFAHRSECIALALGAHRPSGLFLDVGGGNGVVSARLAADGIETVVLEPGRDGAANARRRGLPTVACATIEQAAFAPGSFGAAGLFDVIEHVEDDAGILERVADAVRPGGLVCVTVPAYEWLWSGEDVLAGHHRRYTLASLRSVLGRTGFDVSYATYFFAALTAPLFALRSLPHALGRRATITKAADQHVPSARTRRALDLLLAPERRRIRAGRTIPLGTSCLAVAVRR